MGQRLDGMDKEAPVREKKAVKFSVGKALAEKVKEGKER